MSAYLQQEFDFIERTQKIIEQYNSFQLKEEEKFEVTLLLNCFVGLLILPQQAWLNYLPETIISENEWGINPDHVIFVSNNETKSVKNIARHLRNSISHYHFTAFNDINSNIHGVIFTDQNLRGKENFKANFSIEEIRLFINKFSDIMLETIANSK